jgi:hypothetical protein
MATLFKFTDVDGDKIAVFDASIPGEGAGVNIRTTFDGCSLPDDEIPHLISALQHYMSKRANEIAKGAGKPA